MNSIDWQLIVQDLGLFGITVSALTWLIKKALDLKMKKELEQYKQEMDEKSRSYQHELDTRSRSFQHELDSKVEAFKADSAIRNIRFSNLQAKRLKIMRKIYGKLVDVDQAMIQLTATIKRLPEGKTSEESDFEDAVRAQDTLKAFQDYYLPNRIVFSKKICEMLDELNILYNDGLFNGTWKIRDPSVTFTYNYELLKKANEVITEAVPPIIEDLEKEFRNTLGVE